MPYVTFNRLPPYTQDIFRFINGAPVRVPTVGNVGINRFASVGRSGYECNPSKVPSHNDPRLMTMEQWDEYQNHPAPYGENARLYGL